MFFSVFKNSMLFEKELALLLDIEPIRNCSKIRTQACLGRLGKVPDAQDRLGCGTSFMYGLNCKDGDSPPIFFVSVEASVSNLVDS